MAHPSESAGAVDVPVTHTVDSAAAALRDVFASEPQEEREEEAPDEGELDPNVNDEFADEDFADEGEETEGEEAAESDEPDEPAIEAPVSLTADEKAEFSQLPKEAQDYVTRLEQRRNQDVQKVTTKAAEAQRVAEAKAAEADTEAKRVYAEKLRRVVAQQVPNEPDPSQFSDINTFRAAQQRYQQTIAHLQGILGEADKLDNEIAEMTAKEVEAFKAQRERDLMAIPEIANEETRKAYFEKVESAAEKLGYSMQELAETMDAEDVKRLHSVAQAFEDQAKYKAAMSRQMKRVRAGKSRNLKPGTAQPTGSGNRAYDQAKQRLAQTGSVDDAAAAFKAIL